MKINYPAATVQHFAIKKWIMEIPVISSSHFAESELGNFNPLFTDDNNRAVILCIETTDDFVALNKSVTDSTLAVVGEFQALGYSYLRIDPDGDVVPGLPVFDW